MSDNWLERHFLNKPSSYVSSNSWIDEVSQFERKPQPQLSSGSFLRKTANVAVLGKQEIASILKMAEAENNLRKLANMFNRREVNFDPDIDFSAVLSLKLQGRSWVDAFCQLLGISMNQNSNCQPQIVGEPVGMEKHIDAEMPVVQIANKKSRLIKKKNLKQNKHKSKSNKHKKGKPRLESFENNDSFNVIDQAYTIKSPFGPTVVDYKYPMYPASLISNLRNAPYPYSQVYAKYEIK